MAPNHNQPRWRWNPAALIAEWVVLRLETFLGGRLDQLAHHIADLQEHMEGGFMAIRERLQALLDQEVETKTTISGSISGFVGVVVKMIQDLKKEVMQADVPPEVAAMFDNATATLTQMKTEVVDAVTAGTEAANADPVVDPPPPPPPDEPPVDVPPVLDENGNPIPTSPTSRRSRG